MNLITHEFTHSDDRRVLNQVLSANIKQVNSYACEAGVELGNHYHDKTTLSMWK